ncbi:hypothetical protein Q8F55_008250 [Vanrija albida]|uniref:Uncharacterized protein n=1 Tax=Vanrija albida TaxID=181172 RepID=A0ABR3PVP8_9TREE
MSRTPRRRRRPTPEIYNLALTEHPGYAAFHKYEHYDEVVAKIERSAARGWPSHRGLVKNFLEHMDVLAAARDYLATMPPECKPLTPGALTRMRAVSKLDHFDYIKSFIDMHEQRGVRAELMVQGLSKGYLHLLACEPWAGTPPAYPPMERRLARQVAKSKSTPAPVRAGVARTNTCLRLIEAGGPAHGAAPPPPTRGPSPRARAAFELRASIAAIEKQINVLHVESEEERWKKLASIPWYVWEEEREREGEARSERTRSERSSGESSEAWSETSERGYEWFSPEPEERTEKKAERSGGVLGRLLGGKRWSCAQ